MLSVATRSRNLTRAAFAALILLVSAAVCRAQDLYKPDDGPFGVKQIDQDWTDASRERKVPVRIYLPQSRNEKKDGDKGGDDKATPPAPAAAKFPVIVFSHGLGASRSFYGYFGKHMASWGYIVIAPTHAGSDTASLRDWMAGTHGKNGKDGAEGDKKPDASPQRGWLMSSIEDPANLTNRPKDISFIIDQLTVNETLKEIADTTRIGVAGHSFGAYTAMAIGGLTVDLPDEKAKSFRDPRVKAVLPMSPEGPGTMGITPTSWDKFNTTVMYLTGTRDYGVAERSVTWRRSGFTNVHGVDDYLVTLNGAGHMTFGGGGNAGLQMLEPNLDGMRDGPTKKDAGEAAEPTEVIRDRIRERLRQRMEEKQEDKAADPAAESAHHVKMIDSFSTAFFDAYLREDAAAKEWLKAYFSAPKHDDCTAEFKPGPEAQKPVPPVPPPVPAPPLSERDKIERMLQFLTASDAVFIRNGSEYNGTDAASHLRTKWDAAGKRIKTARDFIDNLASASSASGKPYQIREKDGAILESRAWFSRLLTEIESPPKEKPK